MPSHDLYKSEITRWYKEGNSIESINSNLQEWFGIALPPFTLRAKLKEWMNLTEDEQQKPRIVETQEEHLIRMYPTQIVFGHPSELRIVETQEEYMARMYQTQIDFTRPPQVVEGPVTFNEDFSLPLPDSQAYLSSEAVQSYQSYEEDDEDKDTVLDRYEFWLKDSMPQWRQTTAHLISYMMPIRDRLVQEWALRLWANWDTSDELPYHKALGIAILGNMLEHGTGSIGNIGRYFVRATETMKEVVKNSQVLSDWEIYGRYDRTTQKDFSDLIKNGVGAVNRYLAKQ